MKQLKTGTGFRHDHPLWKVPDDLIFTFAVKVSHPNEHLVYSMIWDDIEKLVVVIRREC